MPDETKTVAATSPSTKQPTAPQNTKKAVPKTAKTKPATVSETGAKTEAKTETTSKMALRITAKPKEGFRRCGVHHPSEAVDYPEGRFSQADIKILKAETNLVVEEL